MLHSWMTVAVMLMSLFLGCTTQTPSNSPDSFIVVPANDATSPTAGMLVNDNFKVQIEVIPSSQPMTIYAGSDVVSVIGSATDTDGGIKNVKLFSTLTAYADVGIGLSIPTVLGVLPSVNVESQSTATIGGSTLKSRPVAKNFDLKALLGTQSRIKLDVWIEGENFSGAKVTTARASILYPARQQGDTVYMANCRRHNVPVPPDWEESGTAWQVQGNLGNGTNLLNPGEDAFVWTYGGPVRGGCIVLPRQSGLAGIICQSAMTGYACFWDNKLRIDGPDASDIGWKNKRLIISELQDGDNLKENCTSCHRGNNVFLISPDDPTWTTLLRSPLVTTPGSTFTSRVEKSLEMKDGHPRYIPFSSKATWKNEFRAGGGACAQCHEFPELGFGPKPPPETSNGQFPPMPPSCANGKQTPEDCYGG